MSFISSEDAAEVVSRLLDRTRSKGVSWQVWGDTATEYTTTTSRFHYYVRSRDEDNAAPYILEIWKKTDEGKAIQLEEIQTREGSAANGPLEALYQAAKLSAFGIESLKRDILDDLS